MTIETKEANDTVKQLKTRIAEEMDKSESLESDFAQSEIRKQETVINLQSNISELEQTIEKLRKEHEEVTKIKFEIILSIFSCSFLSTIFPNQ